ncbi:hypothetical protein, partial [Escherichia coli]|uniref:hypothetical protein n=1 Tax=Escherichia coli TaxID=562 RepID=UPI001BC8A1AF
EKRVFLVILFTSFSGSLVSRIPGAVQADLFAPSVGICILSNREFPSREKERALRPFSILYTV